MLFQSPEVKVIYKSTTHRPLSAVVKADAWVAGPSRQTVLVSKQGRYWLAPFSNLMQMEEIWGEGATVTLI